MTTPLEDASNNFFNLTKDFLDLYLFFIPQSRLADLFLFSRNSVSGE